MSELRQIAPQKGPQSTFLATEAEIAIYGGAAGAGKSYALLLEPLRNVITNSLFYAVIFRRTTVSIRRPGSLWDESMHLYSEVQGATPTQHNLEWKFDKGGKVVMAHLEYDSTVLEWHAAQVPLIMFDELTEFSERQFFYMLSRNRSLSGVKPYVRATCNPDANSWVATLISWYIDQETGYPITERSGKVRWFLRVGDELIWRDRQEDLRPELLGLPVLDREGREILYIPKSFTFIAADIYDNEILMAQNPEYLGNLMALPTVERERLLRGNWKIKPSAGLYFKRDTCPRVKLSQVPSGLKIVRGHDLAATEKTQLNNPDWSTGTKIGYDATNKLYYVLDHTYVQLSPAKLERHLKIIAIKDGVECSQIFPKDPGQAGKWQVQYLVVALAGFHVKSSAETGDKAVRFGPFSSMAGAGRVIVVEGDWNERWFSILESFTGDNDRIDDDVDSTSRAFNDFLGANLGLLDFYQEMAQEDLINRNKTDELPKSEADGGMRVKSPSEGVNVLYDMRGRPIFRNADGTFLVSEKHFESLSRAGFVKVEAEIIDLAEIREELRTSA